MNPDTRARAQKPLTRQERYEFLEGKIKSNENLQKLNVLISGAMKVPQLDSITKKHLLSYVAGIGMTRYLNFNRVSEVNNDIVKNFISSLNSSPADEVEAITGTMEDELNRFIMTGKDDSSYFTANTRKGHLESFSDTEKLQKGSVAQMSPYQYSYTMRQGYTMEESGTLLDSRYRDKSHDLSNHIYHWGYSPVDFGDRSGIFTTHKEVSNIIGIQLHKFSIPSVALADNIYNRISILFENLPSPMVGREGRKYHFMCTTDKTDPNFIELTPIKEQFNFNTPIKEISGLDVSFASPLQRFSFGTDEFSATATDLNPTEFTATNHGLQSNNLAFILDYDTTDSSGDIAKINEVNSDNGHSVTYIDDNTFSVQVDTSGVTASGTAKVFNGNKRFWIPITFIHLKTEEYSDI